MIAPSGPVAFIWLGFHFPTDGTSGEKSYVLVRSGANNNDDGYVPPATWSKRVIAHNDTHGDALHWPAPPSRLREASGEWHGLTIEGLPDDRPPYILATSAMNKREQLPSSLDIFLLSLIDSGVTTSYAMREQAGYRSEPPDRLCSD